MTHSPPVPPASQSPFPRHEAPHEHHAAVDAPLAAVAKAVPELGGMTVGVGVALGIGAAALLGTWLFMRGGSPKPAARKTPARRTPATKRTNRRTTGAPAQPRTARSKRATDSDAPKS